MGKMQNIQMLKQEIRNSYHTEVRVKLHGTEIHGNFTVRQSSNCPCLELHTIYARRAGFAVPFLGYVISHCVSLFRRFALCHTCSCLTLKMKVTDFV